MGFLDKNIQDYTFKLEQLRIAKAQIEAIGLSPQLPAISKSEKIAVLLSSNVEVSMKKNAEGKEVLVTKIVGIKGTGKDSSWYDINDLVPYTEAARILYLK